ncbi:MAG: D-aminoacyl-tRNA deacylase [Symbiobacteriia bacterium]
MRAVVQRVSRAAVRVDDETVGAIGAGLLVLLGVARGDGPEDARQLADKVAGLRIFDDAAGKMNLSLTDVGGAVLAVSQFTLLGDARQGRRPSYSEAAPPAEANPLYQQFVGRLRTAGLTVAEGIFRAEMQVELVNEGPVTLLLDSRRTF